MAKKNPLKTNVSTGKAAYRSFNSKNLPQVLTQHGKTIDRFDSVIHTTKEEKAVADTSTNNYRAPYNPWNYYAQRPWDWLPRLFREIILSCRMAYIGTGVVRNVIDLMCDFACDGLEFVHPDKKVEAFFKVWMRKTQLKSTMNEFARHFLVDGNVVLTRTIAKLTKPVEMQWMDKVNAVHKLKVENPILKERQIPWKYNFVNINALKWVGGDLNKTYKTRQLVFKLPQTLQNSIKGPSEPFVQMRTDQIPDDVKKSLTPDKDGFITLDMDKIYFCHNKKDSWEDWAIPFLYTVLADLHFKDKLRQAEISALDGVINVIRLWKIGDHKEKIFPADGAIDRLIEILQSNTGGGAIDIVWDSMIAMEDFYPPVKDILGPEKYTQVDKDILIGLGVPEVLLGGEGANFSNSFIQLKTMVGKLDYVRNEMTNFLEKEVQMVCESMNIASAPLVRFGDLDMEDANITKKLIIGLFDRGIISAEAVQRVYGEDPTIELERIKIEKDLFKQYKVKVQGPFDQKPAAAGKPKGQPGQGKPLGTPNVGNDTRTAKPKRGSKANQNVINGISIIEAIDQYAIPIIMESMGVSNARKLTFDQKEEINESRLLILSCIKDTDELSEDNILSIAGSCNNINLEVIEAAKASIANFTSDKGSQPSLSQRKTLEAMAWAEINGVDNG